MLFDDYVEMSVGIRDRALAFRLNYRKMIRCNGINTSTVAENYAKEIMDEHDLSALEILVEFKNKTGNHEIYTYKVSRYPVKYFSYSVEDITL